MQLLSLSRPFNSCLSFRFLNWLHLNFTLWSGTSGQETKHWQIFCPLSRPWFSKQLILHLPMPPPGTHYSWRTTLNLHFAGFCTKMWYIVFVAVGSTRYMWWLYGMTVGMEIDVDQRVECQQVGPSDHFQCLSRKLIWIPSIFGAQDWNSLI